MESTRTTKREISKETSIREVLDFAKDVLTSKSFFGFRGKERGK